MDNQPAWSNEKILKHMQKIFIGSREISDYQIEKKYLQKQNSRIKIFFTQIVKKQTQVKASILYIHGLGEHQGRNYNIATRLCDLGYQLYMMDFTGHGFSFGPRSMLTQKNIIQDIELSLKQIRTDIPCFLMGHSMGGGSVLAFSQLNPDLKLAGIICINPFIELGNEQQGVFMMKYVIPYLPTSFLVIQKILINYQMIIVLYNEPCQIH